jgi:predicted ATPase/DNA-binding winged helix-turn-helix (wHTH) protein
MRYRFEDYVLDDDTFELRRNGEPVSVEPKVFDVLRHLVENHDRVVEKAELLDEVWGDQFVAESTLSTRIKQARQAVGDDGRNQRVIKTSHGRGFRFVAAVEPDGAAGVDGPDLDQDGHRADSQPTAPARSTVDEPRPRPGRDVVRPRPVEIWGRDVDRASIERRLRNRRLVTVVGMGGMGKTQLAHHIGQQLADRYQHGAVAVELAPVRAGDAVANAFLEAVGGGDEPSLDPAEATLGWLADREVLLIIDNAEHVAREVADMCRSILRRCPGVHVLVTSRERLNVVGESVHPLGPLDERDAVALFVERAYDGGVEVDGDRTDVVQLCRRVDGVPLAVEILAARAPLLSVADLAADLERHLSSSLPAGDRRHHTLDAALRSSFVGLAELERRLLEDLTVFAGSFDLAAVETVSGLDDVTEPLLELCRRSLLVPNPESTVSRFRMLEPVRLFARSSNAALGQARARHASHYLAVAEQADRVIDSPDISDGLAHLGLEWPNLRAAFDWMESEGDLDSMSRLVVATANYAEARLLTEVHRWADRAHRAAIEAGVEPDIELVANLARFQVHHGDLDRIQALIGGVSDTGSNHVRMGIICRDWYQGRVEEVSEILDRALDEQAGLSGYWELTFGVLRLMSAPVANDRPTHLLARLQAGAARPSPVHELFAALARGVEIDWSGDPAASLVHFDSAVAQAESLGFAGFTQIAHNMRASAHRSLADPSSAAPVLAASIRRNVDSGGLSLVAESLGSAATILIAGGRADIAVQVLAARRQAGYRIAPRTEAGFLSRCEELLGADELAANEAAGRRLDLSAAIELAVTGLDGLSTDRSVSTN